MTGLRKTSQWRLRTRVLETGVRTLVMGVVNITPDSFSDGGRFLDQDAAIAHSLKMLDEGADIIDLGAESTRPGSHAGQTGTPESESAVTPKEEQNRLLPVLDKILKARPNAVISVDTYKAETARVALAHGAEIVNDVSGLTWDMEMAPVCAELKAGLALMHTRGRPDEWQGQSQLSGDVLLDLVREGLSASLESATTAGVLPESIVIDPGYGFGKRFGENYALLARQESLLSLGYPLLAGVSRKSFLGHTLKPLFGDMAAPVEARENASLAAMIAAIFHGASIVRVHSVRSAVEAARIADALIEAKSQMEM